TLTFYQQLLVGQVRSGLAISAAANLIAVALGTETNGSILCPASSNSISPRQDTIGTVSDAVYVLDAITGFDYNDNATEDALKYIPRGGYKQFLNAHRLKEEEKIKEFGQDIFLAFQATNGIGNKEKAALLNLEKLSGDGFKKLISKISLDALVTPDSDAAHVLAIGGFLGISVPAGYDNKAVPFGITFGGLKGSEPTLIEIAHGFELATKIREPPSFKP
ncbi:putative amidase, partial [Quercus suber]